MTPIARCSRFSASPTGSTMLNIPVFARSKRGYVGARKNTLVFLCMVQTRICKTWHYAVGAAVVPAVTIAVAGIATAVAVSVAAASVVPVTAMASAGSVRVAL